MIRYGESVSHRECRIEKIPEKMCGFALTKQSEGRNVIGEVASLSRACNLTSSAALCENAGELPAILPQLRADKVFAERAAIHKAGASLPRACGHHANHAPDSAGRPRHKKSTRTLDRAKRLMRATSRPDDSRLYAGRSDVTPLRSQCERLYVRRGDSAPQRRGDKIERGSEASSTLRR